MKITEDLRDRLIEALYTVLGQHYDDPDGPWGSQCAFCMARTTDGTFLTVHDDDCEGVALIKELLELEMAKWWTITINGISFCQVYDYSLWGYTKEMDDFFNNNHRCIFESQEEAQKVAEEFDRRFPDFFVEVHNSSCSDSCYPYWRY